MTISITFTAASRVALDAALRDFLGEPGQAMTPQTPAPKASKADPQPQETSSSSTGDAQASEPSPSTNTSGPSTQAEPTSATSDEAIPYPVISKTITDAVTRAGKPAVVALLGKFGAANGKELKADQYAAFKAEAEAL